MRRRLSVTPNGKMTYARLRRTAPPRISFLFGQLTGNLPFRMTVSFLNITRDKTAGTHPGIPALERRC